MRKRLHGRVGASMMQRPVPCHYLQGGLRPKGLFCSQGQFSARACFVPGTANPMAYREVSGLGDVANLREDLESCQHDSPVVRHQIVPAGVVLAQL